MVVIFCLPSMLQICLFYYSFPPPLLSYSHSTTLGWVLATGSMTRGLSSLMRVCTAIMATPSMQLGVPSVSTPSTFSSGPILLPSAQLSSFILKQRISLLAVCSQRVLSLSDNTVCPSCVSSGATSETVSLSQMRRDFCWLGGASTNCLRYEDKSVYT